MSNKHRFIIHFLYIILLITLVTSYSFIPISSSDDIFSHASVGRWIVTHGKIPNQTLFLWSSTKPWIAHSWLSEVVFYLILKTFGINIGFYLSVSLVIVIITTCLILIWNLRKDKYNSLLLPVIFGIGVISGQVRYHPRPELFTDLFLTILLILLVKYRSYTIEVTKRLIFTIPILFIIWANLHGGVSSGLLMLAIVFIVDFIQFRFDKHALYLAGTFILSLIGIFCTPYTYHYLSTLQQIHSNVFGQIEEWMPIYSVPILLPQIIICELIITSIAMFLILTCKQKRHSLTTVLIISTIQFITYRRFAFIHVIVCLVLIAYNSDRLYEFEHKLRLRLGRLLNPKYTTCYVCILCIVMIFGSDAPYNSYCIIFKNSLPDGQIIFLRKLNITGNVYNDYNTSPYFEWMCGDRFTFFIDSLNAYDDSIIDPWRHTLMADAIGLQYLKDHNVVCVIGRNKTQYEPQYPPLYQYLSNSKDWILSYTGQDGPIWIRNN